MSIFRKQDWDKVKSELVANTGRSVIDELSNIMAEEIAKEIDAEILEEIRVQGLSPEEREAEEIIKRLKAPPKKVQQPEDFQKVMMPMIKRVVPNIMANEILGVQPMTESTGQIHTLKVKWGIDKDDL